MDNFFILLRLIMIHSRIQDTFSAFVSYISFVISDSVKPVHEHEASQSETQTTYWPQIVGGPLSNIVGASPARPTFPATETTREPFVRPTRFPQSTTRPRPRISHGVKNSIIGSFVDLLF